MLLNMLPILKRAVRIGLMVFIAYGIVYQFPC